MASKMYEVWLSEGSGVESGPRFRHEEDARRFVARYVGERSLAVRQPDGSFLRFGDEGAILRNKRRCPRFRARTTIAIDLTPGMRGDWPPGRRFVPCAVHDVSAGGLALYLPTDAVIRGAPLLLCIDDELGDLPGQVAWQRAGELGVSVGARDRAARTRYIRWVGRVADVAQDALARGTGRHRIRRDDD